METTLRATAAFTPEAHRAICRRMMFDCCKWDPQFEDVSVLADFALTIDAAEWATLCSQTEKLARETLAMERELLLRPELHRRLSLPRAIRAALRNVPKRGASVEGPRVMRFDFHPTREGWRISEVNSDVPGGFIEASALARLAQSHVDSPSMFGDPTVAYADAVRAAAGESAVVALVHATAFVDDRQVMLWMAKHLEERGLRAPLVAPDQLRWIDGRAFAETEWHRGPVDMVLRFFPAEWLPELPRASGWRHFVAGARTPLSNPATALLSQGKRLPLVWDELRAEAPTWRALLPETRDPRKAAWRRDASWLLKPTLGRVGDGIAMAGVTKEKEMRAIRRAAFLWPSEFVAQRRFDAFAIDTPRGPRWPCLGIYAIDGRAAGAYVRLGAKPCIDGRAEECALLVLPEAAASAATAA